MQDFEKLGVFYLGRAYDLAAKKAKEDLILYDSKDLTTHAVCVGMTGSGKTGLCLSLLEEAAIDGIPAVVIDPKGDLADLLLTFPDLKPEDFAPWVNEDEARRKGMSREDFAKSQAELWKNGLAEWGQDGARIRRMREAADLAIYTPGSTAGLPVSVLKSFDAPEGDLANDPEMVRERINAIVTSLLGLLGIDADPLQSREHILISSIIQAAWKDGQSVDMPRLIQLIHKPPIQRVGVIELESFFPEKDRFALAMKLNNLLASPGFEAWTVGEPLDLKRLLYTPDGKPRIAIFSIAHLSDPERMFFVSLLLNQTLSWVRTLSGTTSLRAIVYMDEIYGYFPPVANPPSKAPLLTLLKQARAFGVGVVLATQNPVDLDYKGLSNCGTWLIGRLQTERDKARVLEGLEGAAAGQGHGFDRKRMEQTLAGLGNRLFLMNNVHEDAPVVFQVRWAMSYLAGPLTRDQIKQLMSDRKAQAPIPAPASPAATPTPTAAAPTPIPKRNGFPTAAASSSGSPASAGDGQRPLLPAEIAQVFLPVRVPRPPDSTLIYQPSLVGVAKVYYEDKKAGVAQEESVTLLALLGDEPASSPWDEAEEADLSNGDLGQLPASEAQFGPLTSAAGKPKQYAAWRKELIDSIYRGRSLDLLQCASMKILSKPGENERDFRIRLRMASREGRDEAIAKLKAKYAPKFTSLRDQLRRAEDARDREAAQARQSTFDTAISIGSSILGAIVGRKKLDSRTLGKATTAARGANRTMKQRGNVDRAEDSIAAIEQQIADLDAQFRADAADLEDRLDPMSEPLETVAIKPKKTNIGVGLLALAWAPNWQGADGRFVPAWK